MLTCIGWHEFLFWYTTIHSNENERMMYAKENDHKKKGKFRSLAANAKDLDEESDDSGSALSMVKSLHDFKETLGKLF